MRSGWNDSGQYSNCKREIYIIGKPGASHPHLQIVPKKKMCSAIGVEMGSVISLSNISLAKGEALVCELGRRSSWLSFSFS